MIADPDWLTRHPEIRSFRTVTADLNGQARGKRLPVHAAAKALGGGVRMPLSVLNVDIGGNDIADSPLLFASGDRDGVLQPTGRGFLPAPWLDAPAALLPMWMFTEDGAPFAGDPRHALDAVLTRYAARGWTPICGVELEFYLIDDSGADLRPPPSPRSGKRRLGGEILSLPALDAFDPFFSALHAACDAMDIPAQSTISEAGMGQYEVDLAHGPALKAADDAFLFKLLTRSLARRHGFAASFMAKPYPEHSGSGLHMHFSVLDRDGRNLFDDGSAAGSDALRQAVAGCLAAMPDSALILAPHATSYDRFVSGAHAPTGIAWAYENRTAALRIPAGPGAARRIEHRVAGGDINPYLFAAAILGAALVGLEDAMDPPAPITGNAYAQDLPQIPATWAQAVAALDASTLLPRFLAPDLLANLAATKRQEMRLCENLDSAGRLDLYLDTV